MNILLLGGGGREHALAWKISQSKACKALFIGPGNAGTSAFGTNLLLDPTDFPSVGKACLHNGISMVVVGPEEPLVKGIVDYFLADNALSHIPVIGPTASAARLEGTQASLHHGRRRCLARPDRHRLRGRRRLRQQSRRRDGALSGARRAIRTPAPQGADLSRAPLGAPSPHICEGQE